MWWLLPSALAAPVGNPLPNPEMGLTQAGVRLGADAAWESDADCAGAANCDARWQRTLTAAVARLNLLPVVAVGGEVGWHIDRVREAGYRGTGLAYAVDARGALPLAGGWRLAAVGRLEQGWGTTPDTVTEERDAWRLGNATGLLAWSDADRVITLWTGGQSAWLWDHEIQPLGTAAGDLSLPLEPAVPFSGVLGAALASEDLGGIGAPSWHLSLELEGVVGQSNGMSLGLSAQF